MKLDLFCDLHPSLILIILTAMFIRPEENNDRDMLRYEMTADHASCIHVHNGVVYVCAYVNEINSV